MKRGERGKRIQKGVRFFLFSAGAFFLVAAETAWADAIQLWGGAPMFVLVLCICVSVFAPPTYAVFLSAVCGLWMDFAKGLPVGADCLLYTYISVMCVWLKERFYFRRLYQVMALVFCGVLLYGAVSSRIYSLWYGTDAATLLWGTALCSAAISPLFYVFLRRKEV